MRRDRRPNTRERLDRPSGRGSQRLGAERCADKNAIAQEVSPRNPADLFELSRLLDGGYIVAGLVHAAARCDVGQPCASALRTRRLRNLSPRGVRLFGNSAASLPNGGAPSTISRSAYGPSRPRKAEEL